MVFSEHEGTFECEHCGAVYDVTYTRYHNRDQDSHACEQCGKRMEWNDTDSPSNFRLRKNGGKLD